MWQKTATEEIGQSDPSEEVFFSRRALCRHPVVTEKNAVVVTVRFSFFSKDTCFWFPWALILFQSIYVHVRFSLIIFYYLLLSLMCFTRYEYSSASVGTEFWPLPGEFHRGKKGQKGLSDIQAWQMSMDLKIKARLIFEMLVPTILVIHHPET